jgi:glutamine amidotransferase
MCRLFAMQVGSTPVSATFWLLDAPDSLAAQSRRNPDGAGIGSYDTTGQPVIDKQPLAAWQDLQFATTARELRATTFVAHVRYASNGALTVANTHPFLQQGRLFAHNGVVAGLDQLDDRLTELGVRHLVQGETDSERVFALITGEIARHRDDVNEGLSAAIDWIADRLQLYALNLVLATSTELWALRYPATHELYLLERPARTNRQLHATSNRIRARSAELADSAAVIIASERMDDDPGWRLVQPGELLHVQADLQVTSSSPFRQPRQLLRPDQLSPTAAASQHPG